jgi:hypothetical protein
LSEKINSFDKKPYVEPRLIVYGDIQVITQAVNMVAGALDGGVNAMGGLQKTN